MFLYWDPKNIEHIGEHGVSVEEVGDVLDAIARPYPQDIGDAKLNVWGQTAAGRYLQVIFVYRSTSTIDLRYVRLDQRMELLELDEVPYVIHARDLTPNEKRRYGRRKRS